MNPNLKHWKEAATLILAAGRSVGAGRSHGPTHHPHKSRFDYDVLLLKRSRKSGFMPSVHVFPGGVVDSSDFSSEWLEVFRSFRDFPNFGLRSVEQPPETRPPIFATDRLKLGSPVPGEVAFRICALREAFEESGVLLVVSKRDEKRLLENACAGQPPPSKVNELCRTELTKWRARVNQNPSSFIQMCRELEVLPNIWALHEWANWLTPRARYGATRFDTAFFMCCLQEAPHALQDQREIEGFQWSTPSEILQSSQAQELLIAPPQFYELSRMCYFPLLKDLHSFARQRATEGCERWLPVVLSKDEHIISLLPGDRLYPPNASGETDTSTDSQLNDPQEDPTLHRMVLINSYTTTIQATITPKYKHLLPVVEPAEPHDTKSQL